MILKPTLPDCHAIFGGVRVKLGGCIVMSSLINMSTQQSIDVEKESQLNTIILRALKKLFFMF